MAGLSGGLAALSQPLRRQAAQVGMDRAERWIAISDGGAGMEGWLRENFPRAEVVILDFYHAAEHLSDWAKALHPPAETSQAVNAAAEYGHDPSGRFQSVPLAFARRSRTRVRSA